MLTVSLGYSILCGKWQRLSIENYFLIGEIDTVGDLFKKKLQYYLLRFWTPEVKSGAGFGFDC